MVKGKTPANTSARLSKQDREFLAHYDPAQYDRPSVAVDIVIFTFHEKQLQVLLVKRGQPPFQGAWALPGGFVNKAQDHSLEDVARRELTEVESCSVFLGVLRDAHGPARDSHVRVIQRCRPGLVVPRVERLHVFVERLDLFR